MAWDDIYNLHCAHALSLVCVKHESKIRSIFFFYLTEHFYKLEELFKL